LCILSNSLCIFFINLSSYYFSHKIFVNFFVDHNSDILTSYDRGWRQKQRQEQLSAILLHVTYCFFVFCFVNTRNVYDFKLPLLSFKRPYTLLPLFSNWSKLSWARVVLSLCLKINLLLVNAKTYLHLHNPPLHSYICFIKHKNIKGKTQNCSKLK
jgi:hypothetical protein